MKPKRILKIIALVAIAGIVIGGGIGLYMFNMPHRDIQSAPTDYILTSSQIVEEYLLDKDGANEKYLSEDGNSKILEITGMLNKISEDFDGRKVVLIKNAGDKAGVMATFTDETAVGLEGVQTGQSITIKGVIRSGAGYNDDLGMYENVIIEKSKIVMK